MKKSILIIILLTLVVGFWWIIVRYFTLADIQRIGKQAGDFSMKNPVAVFLLVAAAQAGGMILSLPTKALLSVLAGAMLGPFVGGASTLLGVLSGTSVLFFAARYFLRNWVVGHLGTRLKSVEDRLTQHPIRSMIGLRLFVTLPYGPITLAASLSAIRYRDFLVGTLIGDLPVIAAYSIAGRQLFSMTRMSEAVSPWTLLALIGVGIFFIVTAVVGRKRPADTRSS